MHCNVAHVLKSRFSLENQNIHTRCILNILFSLRKDFYKWIVSTNFYLMVCVQTAKDVRCKIKISDEFSQKRSVQAEVLLSFQKQLGEPMNNE